MTSFPRCSRIHAENLTMHCSFLEGKKLFSPIFTDYGFHQFKDKSESFSPPLWDPWKLDWVSFTEHLFNKGMVPKKTQPPGQICSWPGQPFRSPQHGSHLSLECSRVDTLHGQNQKVKGDPQEMKREGAIQQGMLKEILQPGDYRQRRNMLEWQRIRTYD